MNRMVLSLGTATVLALSIATAFAKDKPSETFLKKAIEGNFAEVSMGDLAQKNGQGDDVKSYGKMLSTDHAAANQRALEAAKGLGVNSTLWTECEAKSRLREDVKNVGRRLRQNVRHTHGCRSPKRYR